MAYSYEQIFAADPANPSNVAQNASITIFAPGDGTMTPISITDPDGQPLTNPIPVNANGFGSAFAHATLDRVAWAGGGFTGFFTSYEGMKQVALDAQAAAETAQAAAVTASTNASEAAAGALPRNPALSVTYNPDGSVATTTENGVLTTFTYNTDGTVNTQTSAGVTRTFTYDANGNVTGAA